MDRASSRGRADLAVAGRSAPSRAGSALHHSCTGETGKVARPGPARPPVGSRRDLAVERESGRMCPPRAREDFKMACDETLLRELQAFPAARRRPPRRAGGARRPGLPRTAGALPRRRPRRVALRRRRGRGGAVHRGQPRPEDPVLAVPARGDLFGELALLDEGSRTATARRARRRSCIVVEPRRPADASCSRSPDAAMDLLAAMAAMTRRADEVLRTRVSPNVNEAVDEPLTPLQRIANWIAWFSRQHVVPLPQRRSFRGVDRVNTSPRRRRTSTRSLRPADDDRLARGDLPLLFVLISQNRQAREGPLRADVEYEVNVTCRARGRPALHAKADRTLRADDGEAPRHREADRAGARRQLASASKHREKRLVVVLGIAGLRPAFATGPEGRRRGTRPPTVPVGSKRAALRSESAATVLTTRRQRSGFREVPPRRPSGPVDANAFVADRRATDGSAREPVRLQRGGACSAEVHCEGAGAVQCGGGGVGDGTGVGCCWTVPRRG